MPLLRLACVLGFLYLSTASFGQIGIGVTYGVDLYQHLKNPVDTAYSHRGVGSALVNLNIGPKIWIGLKNVSISAEAQASYAPFAFDIQDYKGLGAVSFPMLVQLNFGGLSTFKRDGGLGFSIGAGTTFFLTDLYLRNEDYEDLDLELQQTIFGQVAVGLGTDGVNTYLYGRYGEGDNLTSVYNVGIMIDYNLSTRKKIRLDRWK